MRLTNKIEAHIMDVIMDVCKDANYKDTNGYITWTLIYGDDTNNNKMYKNMHTLLFTAQNRLNLNGIKYDDTLCVLIHKTLKKLQNKKIIHYKIECFDDNDYIHPSFKCSDYISCGIIIRNHASDIPHDYYIDKYNEINHKNSTKKLKIITLVLSIVFFILGNLLSEKISVKDFFTIQTDTTEQPSYDVHKTKN